MDACQPTLSGGGDGVMNRQSRPGGWRSWAARAGLAGRSAARGRRPQQPGTGGCRGWPQGGCSGSSKRGSRVLERSPERWLPIPFAAGSRLRASTQRPDAAWLPHRDCLGCFGDRRSCCAASERSLAGPSQGSASRGELPWLGPRHGAPANRSATRRRFRTRWQRRRRERQGWGAHCASHRGGTPARSRAAGRARATVRSHACPSHR